MKCTYCGKREAEYAVTVMYAEQDHPQGMRCQACTIACFKADLRDFNTFVAYVVKPLR
jgi:hypothetical protein